MTKQQLTEKLYNAISWLQTQISLFATYFWPKMAQWSDKLADFSRRQAAAEFNHHHLPEPPSSSQNATLPNSVLKVLTGLHGQARQSHTLLENIAQQSTIQPQIQEQVHQSHTLLEQLVQRQAEINDQLNRINSASPQTEPTEVPTPPPSSSNPNGRITVALANELRVYLEKNNLFDETHWLQLWLEEPAPCELAKRLLNQYPQLQNCEPEIYQGIATWLSKVAADVQLMIPELNQPTETERHEVVEERAQEKGRVGRVLEIKRPGLQCGDTLLLKAQVISS